MAVIDLYSKRQRKLRGEVPDVFTYDAMPKALRTQIVHILSDCFGDGTYIEGYGGMENAFSELHSVLVREYGIFDLYESQKKYGDKIAMYVLHEDDIEKVLDVVELSFRYLKVFDRHWVNSEMGPDDAIKELNARFLEHGVGYEYVSKQIVRKNSEFIHSEVVRPALLLLSNDKFSGANDEFLSAHTHYRHGRYEECLVDCLKAFEGTMKIICALHGWDYENNATASRLIDVCLEKGLLPRFSQEQLTSLRTGLKSGIPTLRNRQGGHGRGTEIRSAPQSFAKYCLHLTATTLLLLLEAEKEL